MGPPFDQTPQGITRKTASDRGRQGRTEIRARKKKKNKGMEEIAGRTPLGGSAGEGKKKGLSKASNFREGYLGGQLAQGPAPQQKKNENLPGKRSEGQQGLSKGKGATGEEDNKGSQKKGSSARRKQKGPPLHKDITLQEKMSPKAGPKKHKYRKKKPPTWEKKEETMDCMEENAGNDGHVQENYPSQRGKVGL